MDDIDYSKLLEWNCKLIHLDCFKTEVATSKHLCSLSLCSGCWFENTFQQFASFKISILNYLHFKWKTTKFLKIKKKITCMNWNGKEKGQSCILSSLDSQKIHINWDSWICSYWQPCYNILNCNLKAPKEPFNLAS